MLVIHRPAQGIDSHPGTIKSVSGDFELRYDIGGMAGDWSGRATTGSTGWRRQETINGFQLEFTLDWRSKMYISVDRIGGFESGYVDEKQIEQLLEAMRTFRVRE